MAGVREQTISNGHCDIFFWKNNLVYLEQEEDHILMSAVIVGGQTGSLESGNPWRHSEEQLRNLFDLSPLGMALTDMRGRYVQFNEAFRNILGYTTDELKAFGGQVLTPQKYEAEDASHLKKLLRTGRYGPYEKQYLRKDGSLIDVRLNGMRITSGDGHEYIWSIVEDISGCKPIDVDQRAASAPVGIMITDADRHILNVNKTFVDDSGFSAEEIVGQTPNLFRSGRHDTAFYTAMWESIDRTGSWQGEIWDRCKNGAVSPRWMAITAVTGEDGVTTNYVSTHFNTSESKAAEDEIRHLAFYDALTRLPNRRLLLDRLQRAMVASTRSGHAGALLFIDLDHFKTLNDTLGHDMGDQLLQQVAERLQSCLRETDTVARLGGDEFVIMQEGLSESLEEAVAQARTLGEKALASFAQPFLLDNSEYFSTPSIGVAMFQDHHASVSELLKRADLAMYQAKATGRNTIRFFDPAMQSIVNARVLLESDLRRALREQEFLLYYQPQMDAVGRMTGAEALLRWQHPERGLVSPCEFITMTEDTGQILPLGQWVLETACQQLAKWARVPATAGLDMSVNISARQFYHPDFVQLVLSTLDRMEADPNLLTLELTESLLLTSFEDIVTKMSTLKARGICFSLDDFGTGYSSLSYLKRLPLDQLKIDQSFVRDILTDSNDAAIARTILTLGQNLGLSVIAEGVETRAQLDFLAGSGCNAYQGYFFSQPLSAEDIESFAARNC